jgi:hypothetical protein
MTMRRRKHTALPLIGAHGLLMMGVTLVEPPASALEPFARVARSVDDAVQTLVLGASAMPAPRQSGMHFYGAGHVRINGRIV